MPCIAGDEEQGGREWSVEKRAGEREVGTVQGRKRKVVRVPVLIMEHEKQLIGCIGLLCWQAYFWSSGSWRARWSMWPRGTGRSSAGAPLFLWLRT